MPYALTWGRRRPLPSILPCSASTITKSAPVLASMRETFAPGNICQTPMAGRLPSRRTWASRLERIMLEPTSMVDRLRSWGVRRRLPSRCTLMVTFLSRTNPQRPVLGPLHRYLSYLPRCPVHLRELCYTVGAGFADERPQDGDVDGAQGRGYGTRYEWRSEVELRSMTPTDGDSRDRFAG